MPGPNDSPNTVMPRTMQASRVIALVAAIAGASAPVRSADWFSTRPTVAAAAIRYTSQPPTTAARPPPSTSVNTLVTAVASP